MESIVRAPRRPRTAPRTREPFELSWPPAPACWSLNDEVHIWSASLDQPDSIAAGLKATLSTDERLRAARFRFDQERERYSVARGLLRTILATCVGSAPEALVFHYGPQGKPSLAGKFQESLSFNLSHSGKLALIAVTRGGSIGVDVERVCWLAEAETIVDRFFSSDEKALFRSARDGSKLRTFFRIWTRKEALLKCDGVGIAQIDTGSPPLVFHGCEQELSPAADYIGSVAISTRARPIQTWQWRFEP